MDGRQFDEALRAVAESRRSVLGGVAACRSDRRPWLVGVLVLPPICQPTISLAGKLRTCTDFPRRSSR